MTALLTAAQMRALEQAAIDSGAVTGLELMERAGRGVVAAIFAEWPELAVTAHRAAVLCGPGNNGGDGFVVARLLKERGWQVSVLAADTRTPDALANRRRWESMGRVEPLTAGAVAAADAADLWIDAIFGTGLARAVAGEMGAVLESLAARAGTSRLVAVDLPSGLSSDTGVAPGGGACPAAALTVTFHGMKPGHVLADGPAHCGRVAVADIGLVDPGDVEVARLSRAPGPVVWRKPSAHKYAHGHALILSGPAGAGGAARLAARGALRIGAGLVTLGCPRDALAENAAQLTAIMLSVVDDAEGLRRWRDDPRVTALCLGPGLGLDARGEALVAAALGEDGAKPRPTVLDADALTILARRPELVARLGGHCVLTPHAGEFARLFPDIADRLDATAMQGRAYSKVDATREAAARVGCTVLFKGADTVIAAPDGRCAVNAAVYDGAAPWLATAGSGDVLAGFIAGLLARGIAPFEAAQAAAWLHVECARAFGPGLIAEDLPEVLPRVLRALEAGSAGPEGG